MRPRNAMLLIAVVIAGLSHRSDGQQPRPLSDQLRLAGVMPGGALVYVQARDLSALMKTWLGSTVRSNFYKSASYTAFTRSRIYLKLQDRRQDFEKAVGFGLDEERLAELAGGASAIALYDIGNIEVVFVSESPRERAIATVLFRNAPQFQERSADGASYYVREVATDGGRLNQQFCFAYAGGKLIVTTTEGLMLRALKNAGQAGADSMIPSVVAAAEGAEPGFTTHEATMWLDQVRLNKNRYFTSNWIHGNATAKDRSASGNIESGIIDLQLTREAMIERRWFKLAGDGEPRTLSAQQIIALSRFAPTDAKLIEFHAAGDELKASIARTLFGELGTDAASAQWSPPGRDSNDDEEESDGRTTRYRTLDTRFDKDVDDDQPIASTTAVTPGAKLEQSLTTLLGAIAPVGYVEIARSKMEAGKPFVRFERALVIEMQNAGSLDRAALERLITDELRERFVVKGSEPRLEWQEEAGVRYAAQSLMEQAAAYAVSDKYLVLASNRELVRDALKPPAAGAAASRVQSERPLEFFARVRVEAERPVFDKLMSTLDGRVDSAASADPERTIKFFSDNLSSLIAASAVREVTVQRSGGKGSMFELVSYYW